MTTKRHDLKMNPSKQAYGITKPLCTLGMTMSGPGAVHGNVKVHRRDPWRLNHKLQWQTKETVSLEPCVPYRKSVSSVPRQWTIWKILIWKIKSYQKSNVFPRFLSSLKVWVQGDNICRILYDTMQTVLIT